jgi:hypothetical protein
MTKYKELIDLKKASIFLIALPYFTFNISNIIHSPFYSLTQLIFTLTFLFFLEILFKYGLLKLNERLHNIITLLIILTFVLFFYGLYLTTFTQKLFQNYFHFVIRGRFLIEYLLGLFIILILVVKKKNINYQYLNIFLILFSLSTLLISLKNINENGERRKYLKGSIVSLPVKKESLKPILLIITDEYTSPDELYQVHNDSSLYQFSNGLINKKWIVKNNFYTYEISTIHSLGSLFNFNLSKNKEFKTQEATNIGATMLMHSIVADSLEKKKVEILNFGIFHINKNTYLNRLYFYPTSFIENLMMRTIYYTIKINTGNLVENGLASSYYPMEAHNRFILNHLVDTINTLTNKNTFAYIHLFMPHGPMQYMPDFSIRKQNNLINYKAYWNFTNQKLNILLRELIKDNRYRIILTGDHGYRRDKRINPHYTFSAFYGFKKESIDRIESVQDIGSLINSGF